MDEAVKATKKANMANREVIAFLQGKNRDLLERDAASLGNALREFPRREAYEEYFEALFGYTVDQVRDSEYLRALAYMRWGAMRSAADPTQRYVVDKAKMPGLQLLQSLIICQFATIVARYFELKLDDEHAYQLTNEALSK